jgi:OOP family OmpA-OmpF porin
VVPEANVFELGLFGGVFFPSSKHNIQDEYKHHREYNSVAFELGLRLAYYPLTFLGVEAEGAVMPAKVKDGGGAALWAARGHVIAQLPDTRITPFLLLGYGALGGLSKEMGKDFDDAVHFGIGAKAALDEVLSVRLDLRDTVSQKNLDTSGFAHHPELLLGLSMTLDRSKPTPPPPPPPPDGDKDGFADADDACPAVAGVAPKGCPADSDGDGLADDQDQCPTSSGPAPTGCPPPPDRDQDGVLDAADECPDVAGDMANGCPDLDPDKDGVPADKDKCPKEPETANGFQDDDGCPDEVPEAVKRFTGVIKGIEFNFGQATIRPDSRPLLDKAVETLVAYPDVRMKITGHTDDVGARERNVDLSQRRADEVKKYFVSKGVDAARITTHGAGPDQPLDDAKTAAARQKNRRIEFSIVDK